MPECELCDYEAVTIKEMAAHLKREDDIYRQVLANAAVSQLSGVNDKDLV